MIFSAFDFYHSAEVHHAYKMLKLMPLSEVFIEVISISPHCSISDTVNDKRHIPAFLVARVEFWAFSAFADVSFHRHDGQNIFDTIARRRISSKAGNTPPSKESYFLRLAMPLSTTFSARPAVDYRSSRRICNITLYNISLDRHEGSLSHLS